MQSKVSTRNKRKYIHITLIFVMIFSFYLTFSLYMYSYA